jgi:hypothetical protein
MQPTYPIRLAVILAIAAMLAAPFAGHATSGGVNSEGCHNSKAAGYHCHPERAKGGSVAASSQESTRERSRRLKRECKGSRNGGACLGYGSF